jgi:hypothetical protein
MLFSRKKERKKERKRFLLLSLFSSQKKGFADDPVRPKVCASFGSNSPLPFFETSSSLPFIRRASALSQNWGLFNEGRERRDTK